MLGMAMNSGAPALGWVAVSETEQVEVEVSAEWRVERLNLSLNRDCKEAGGHVQHSANLILEERLYHG
jgi:hypothetical protein